MGIDFTSINYPFSTKYQETESSDEGHEEPADESIKSSVVDHDHPTLSPSGLKNTINLNRTLANSEEPLISGDIKEQTMKDMLKAANSARFPFDSLVFLCDIEKKLDTRDGASDAKTIIEKTKGYADELKNSLGRQPLNSEVFMAYMLQSASLVKTILEKSQNEPYKKASPIGSKYDDIIFYKKKYGKKILRMNKEVYQFFNKRMQIGIDVFPHLPLGV